MLPPSEVDHTLGTVLPSILVSRVITFYGVAKGGADALEGAIELLQRALTVLEDPDGAAALEQELEQHSDAAGMDVHAMKCIVHRLLFDTLQGLQFSRPGSPPLP